MGQTRKKNWRKRGMVLDIDMAALRAANQAADEDDEEEEAEEDMREESPDEEETMPIPTSTFIPASVTAPTKTLPAVHVPLEEAKSDVSMWKMVEDASGKPYYWNQDDNSTSWEPPAGWEFRDKTDEDNEQNDNNNDGGPVMMSADTTSNVNVNNELEFGDDEDQKSAADALLRDLDASPLLPDEWAVTIDPNTGKEYYWNKSTGETSWERPVATPSLDAATTTTTLTTTTPDTLSTTFTTTTTVPPTTISENGSASVSSSVDEKESKSPKKERKKNKKREKSASRSRSPSKGKDKSRSRSRSVKDSKKSKKKKHSHKRKDKEKEKDRSKKKEMSDNNDSEDDKERQREKEKERREQERKKEAQKEQDRIEREKKKKREKEEEQRREKEREEGLKEAEERAAETRTKTIVSALSAGIQARVSSLSKIVGLPDRKIAPLDRFKVELEIRIADWKEGATTSSWALSKLQVLAGQLDGIIAEEKEALRDSERQKQEEAMKAQEAARQEREAEKRRKRAEETRTHEPASKSDEAVYAPFGATAKPTTAAVVAPPVHPSRLALITKSEQTSRQPAKEALRRLPQVAPPSPPQASEEEEEEASSSEEELDGVSVTVHQRPSKKNAPVSGDFEASTKKKKRSTTKVFGKQMGALVNKWTKVQKAVDKEARRAEEETSVTGRRAWRAEMEQSGMAVGNANFVELGKRALTKRRRDDED